MLELTLDTPLSISEQVIHKLVGEEAVLLDIDSGMYFGLDPVGCRIWQSVEHSSTLRNGVATVVADYEVEEETARADVLNFAQELLARGLLAVNN